MKHTQGPWRIAKRGAQNIEICNVHGGTIAIMDARLEDKALLIAAAPDLLAALQVLETAARRFIEGKDDSELYISKVCEKARAAISKATA